MRSIIGLCVIVAGMIGSGLGVASILSGVAMGLGGLITACSTLAVPFGLWLLETSKPSDGRSLSSRSETVEGP